VNRADTALSALVQSGLITSREDESLKSFVARAGVFKAPKLSDANFILSSGQRWRKMFLPERKRPGEVEKPGNPTPGLDS
jgi:hypothetical protein